MKNTKNQYKAYNKENIGQQRSDNQICVNLYIEEDRN